MTAIETHTRLSADDVCKISPFHYILTNAGTITQKKAEQLALSEFEKYRIRQDRLYQSDFDKVLLRGTETTLITENETDGIEDENC